jgi:predicted  nucleic acid-binding Zn-ribbon protein
MTREEDLYRLQCLDSERDAKQRRLAEVEAVLGKNDEVQQARQALENIQKQVKKWTQQQRDMELEIQSLSDKIARSEKRLYSGAVKNPKELADLQAEAASLKRWRQKREDDLLETMIEREEAEAAHSEVQTHLDETESRWSAQQADLTAQREELRARLGKIEQAQAKLLPRIEANDLSTYYAVRSRKGGLAVVQERDDACGGCGVTLSPSLEWRLRQEKLVHCDNCERIIVRIE